jgi:hypothetical protein
MKNFFCFVVLVIFLYVSGMAQAFTVKGEESVPPAPAVTKNQLDSLRDELKSLTKGTRLATSSASKDAGLAAKNSNDAKAMAEAAKFAAEATKGAVEANTKAFVTLENTIGDGNKAITANAEATKMVAGSMATVVAATSQSGDAIKANTALLAIAIFIAMVFGCIIIIAVVRSPRTIINAVSKNSIETVRSLNNATDALEKLESECEKRNVKMGLRIAMISEEAAKLIKELEPIRINFDIGGKKVVYTPSIVDGAYKSLYVPIDAEASSDPSKTTRFVYKDVARLRSSVKKVMTEFLAGGFEDATDPHQVMQKEVIRFAQATDELSIA